MLSDLLKPKSVIILSTNSSLTEIYVYDAIKYKANASKQGVIEVKDKKSFNDMMEKIAFEPMMADKWVFQIKYKSVKGSFEKNKRVFEKCDTAYFLVECEKYPDYLKAKRGISCTEIYVHQIRGLDRNFLFGGYLSEALQSFVSKGYGAEKCFELYNYLRDGNPAPKTKSEVQEILGVSESSTRDFVFSLLRDYKGTERSKRIQIRNKSRDMSFLLSQNSVRSLYNFISYDLMSIIQIKQLYINGDLYDSVTSKLPEGYDYNRLSRYNRYFDNIIEIPVERILYTLRVLKESFWWKEEDAFAFIYRYYNVRQDNVTISEV